MPEPPRDDVEAAMREIRARDFARLDESGQVYLDHTGSALYPEPLVRRHAEWLCGSVAGNPHSRSPSSRLSTERLEGARRRILEYFRADPAEYEAVFVPNATGALKLVGEGFPFGDGATFRLTADNHNSVNGIREFARARGADVRYVPLDPDLRVADIDAALHGADPQKCNLFAYPAQSNFSGVQHPLEWIARAGELGYSVLLDAAAFVPTNRLDLSVHRPDFAAISFYKMFGYPTGIGALLARREALHRLRRPWFCGGTVRFASAQNAVHIPYSDEAGFEEGTPNFLSMAAVLEGLDWLDGIGIDRVHDHVTALCDELVRGLLGLRHSGGAPLIEVYGPATAEGRGGTVAFNVRDPDGRVVDCRLVEREADRAGISLRTGYFCNPGAAETSFQLPAEEALRCYEELEGPAFTLSHFSVCLHDRPVGAVRVSLGISSSGEDVRRLLSMLSRFRDPVAAPGPASLHGESSV